MPGRRSRGSSRRRERRASKAGPLVRNLESTGPTRARPAWLLCGLLALLLAPTPATAEPALTLIDAQSGAIERALSEEGTAPLVFHREDVDEGAEFTVDLSDFLSEKKQRASVGLREPDGRVRGKAPARLAHLRFAKGEHRKELELDVGDVVSGVDYHGSVTATAAGHEPLVWRVTLARPQALAEVVADVDRADLEMAIFPFCEASVPTLNVTLREKSGSVAIEGLTIRRAPGSEAHDSIDLSNDLRFYLDGSETADLTSLDAKSLAEPRRNIPVGDQRTLRIDVLELPRGDHSLTLQIDAVNANPESAPKLQLAVHVRHSVLAPALVLLVAILSSYLITKGIVNWRQRMKLRQLADGLAHEWPPEVRGLAPVVWLQATRRQALTVLDEFSLLPAPEALTRRLEVAKRIRNLVRRYIAVREKVEANISSYMLKYRFDGALADAIRDIDPEDLDEAREKALLTELTNLEEAIDDPTLRYRPYVLSSQRRTVGMEVLNNLPIDKKETRHQLEALWKKYVEKEVEPGTDLAGLIAVDRVSASFRVMKRHIDFGGDEAVLRKLVPLVAKDDPNEIEMEKVFAVTNEAFFEHMKLAVRDGALKIAPSRELPSATLKKALVPIQFRFAFDNHKLNETYMATNRVEAHWRFELKPDPPHRWRWIRKLTRTGDASSIPWQASATGSKILQFAPSAGKLWVGLTLRHDAEACDEVRGEVGIESAHVTLTRRLFAIQEIVLLAVAGAIAFASGLVMFYESNASFGSIQDYLALFTWGVGVDQGKNLAQTFQGLTTQAAGEGGEDA